MTSGPNEFCSPALQQSYPKWTTLDAMRWKFLPAKMGGGRGYLLRYKDGWVAYNKVRIQNSATANRIPIDLLAGVAWIEVGGMPDIIDAVAFPIRSFDWSGPNWIDEHFTTTKHPHHTSLGSVSIQLEAAAKTMGINPARLNSESQYNLIKCLQADTFNLDVVAKHLYQLIKHDFPKAGTEHLSDEEIIIVASRYNRGTQRKLGDFYESIRSAHGSEKRAYTEYGRTLLRHREHIRMVLLRGK